MSTRLRQAAIAALTCLIAVAMAEPAGAEKPSGPPGQMRRGGPHPQPVTTPAGVPGLPTVTITIAPRDQTMIRQYFGRQFASGHCPPGLAKKNNGCLPPGQAKKLWAHGRPLAPGIPYYLLPPDLLARLSPPPAGYQYIRIASDVLLMAIGTRMIVDAVRDIGAM